MVQWTQYTTTYCAEDDYLSTVYWVYNDAEILVRILQIGKFNQFGRKKNGCMS